MSVGDTMYSSGVYGCQGGCDMYPSGYVPLSKGNTYERPEMMQDIEVSSIGMTGGLDSLVVGSMDMEGLSPLEMAGDGKGPKRKRDGTGPKRDGTGPGRRPDGYCPKRDKKKDKGSRKP